MGLLLYTVTTWLYGYVTCFLIYNKVELCWDRTFMWFYYRAPNLVCLQIGWLVVNSYRRG